MGELDNKDRNDQADEELDHLLNSALCRYAAAEPRAGLEERVLANLRAQQNEPRRLAWWWTFAAAAVVIAAAILAGRLGRPKSPEIAHHSAVQTQPAQQPKMEAVNRDTPGPQHPAVRSTRPHSNRRATSPVPKRPVFPSPQPLTEQEQLLASYVAQFHEQAVLVARARSELQLRDLQQESQPVDADATEPEISTDR